jgi:hypothetical protein
VFADLRRLRRDILPDGITTGAEMLGLDRIERLHAEWSGYRRPP